MWQQAIISYDMNQELLDISSSKKNSATTTTTSKRNSESFMDKLQLLQTGKVW